ncbi:flagellin [Phycisphaerales bacterium AB-hyl4]|uniref:Flagellin n=1 Tax=Natronomicrosphaera hydrolytica TaxID=3242702 RepID=A0ABV4U879_9BACT
MSRINTNVSALIARHNLERSNNDLSTRLQRLSTGLKINRGADDPAGLIVSERLRNEIAGVTKSIDNVERASNVIATTEAALQEINNLLVDIKGLSIEAANTGAFSREEVEANQLQIDSAIESISRIANTTSFAGLKLLNGSLDYITENVTTSQMTDVRVYSANFGKNDSVPVNVEVLNSAQRGELIIDGDDGGVAAGALSAAVTFEVQGKNGVEVFTFASGTTLSAMSRAINAVTDSTGVSAALVNPADHTDGLRLTTTAFGSDEFVAVRKVEGGENFQTYDTAGAATARQSGDDVVALVNGNLAVGKGLNVSLRNPALNLEFTLSEGAAQTVGEQYEFDITGGGATYQLGPQVNTQQQAGFGIQSVAASQLGNSLVGFLSSVRSGGANALTKGGDAAKQAANVVNIVDTATNQISTLRGRLGAFERNTLQTTMRSSQIALENLTASESSIRDTDFAEETAMMTRAQILQQAGTSTLAMANNTASSVLSLLG